MNTYLQTGTGPIVAPSILGADFGNMAADCASVLRSGAQALHLDVMDGHFVPNLTMGPDMCRWLRTHLPDAMLDVHLMVEDPAAFVEPFAKAGADHLTFHAEVLSPKKIDALAKSIREKGMSVGLAINPSTDFELILDHLHNVDLILVMSVVPGFSGQAFIESTLEKTRAIAELLADSQRLQMDGGIDLCTAPRAREAGCSVLVAASAIFKAPPEQREAVIKALRGDGSENLPL